jgi:hypothetical protein
LFTLTRRISPGPQQTEYTASIRLEDVVEAAPGIGLAGHDQNPLVPLAHERQRLFRDLPAGHGRGADRLVSGAKGAVDALVFAKVRNVERGEQDETLPVDAVLDGTRRGEQLGETAPGR